jgi:hypothetical protein
MELASMLAGERFSDRPSTVCPVVGAVVRAYNDAVDDVRRQDLYRFAADAVGTRGDFALQRTRAELAINFVRGRRPNSKRSAPQPDAGPEEIADHVVFCLARRPRSRWSGRRWDDASHADVLELLERLVATQSSALVGEFVEHDAEPIEDGRRGQEFVVGELGQSGAEPWLDLGAPGLDEGPPSLGERGEDDAPVLVGAGALYESSLSEAVEHLGDAGWAEIGIVRELGGGQTVAVAQAEEQAVLSVAERPAAAVFTPAHPAQGGHRRLEGPAELLGGLAACVFA